MNQPNGPEADLEDDENERQPIGSSFLAEINKILIFILVISGYFPICRCLIINEFFAFYLK